MIGIMITIKIMSYNKALLALILIFFLIPKTSTDFSPLPNFP